LSFSTSRAGRARSVRHRDGSEHPVNRAVGRALRYAWAPRPPAARPTAVTFLSGTKSDICGHMAKGGSTKKLVGCTTRMTFPHARGQYPTQCHAREAVEASVLCYAATSICYCEQDVHTIRVLEQLGVRDHVGFQRFPCAHRHADSPVGMIRVPMTLVPRGRKSGARHGLKFRSVSANGSRQQRFPFCMGLRGYWNRTLHKIVYADGICRLKNDND
jgi:hypothetical protein